MINLLITLSVLLIFAYYICEIFKTTFGKAIPFSFVLICIIQFIAALSGKLSNFKYALILFLGIMIIHLFLRGYKNKFKNFINKDYFSMSLLVFILLFCYLYLNTSNMAISNIDDMGYWGTRLDDMFRNDSLYSVNSYVVYGGKGYPPFTHLLEFGLAKLLGGLSDGNVIFALSSFCYSFFMPLFDRFKFNSKDIIYSIIQFIGIIVLMLCISLNPTNNNPSYIFNSIYVDWLLSIALMYGFYVTYNFKFEKIFDYISIGMVTFVLIFTKQIGLALALLLCVTLFMKMVLDKKINFKSIIIFILICVVIPFLIYYSWSSFANYILTGASNNTISGSLPIGSGFVSGTVSNSDNIKKIMDFFIFSIREPVMLHPIKLSYFAIVIIVTVGLVVFGKINKEKISFYLIPIFYFLGSIGYALGIELSYINLFSDGDTYPLFGRYMQTYTYFGLLLILVLLYDKLNAKKISIILMLSSCLCINPDSIESFIYNPNRIIYREKERTLICSWIDKEYNYQPILVVNQTDMVYLNLFKRMFGEKGENVTYKQFMSEDDVNTFKRYLNENDYIIIGDSNDLFNKLWSEITDIPPYNSTLYKIIKDNNGLSLEMVYTWEN